MLEYFNTVQALNLQSNFHDSQRHSTRNKDNTSFVQAKKHETVAWLLKISVVA